MRFIFILLLILIQTSLYSQKEYSTKSKSAIKLYEDGVSALTMRQFPEAIDNLEKAIEKDSEFVEAYLMLGEVYIEQQQPEKAIQYYSKGMEVKPEFYPPGFIVLGKLNLQNGKYQQAKTSFEKYLASGYNSTKFTKEANDAIKQCDFGIHAIQNPVPFEPINLGDKINTQYDEYWPSLSADEQELVFTVLLPKDENNPNAYRNRQEDFYYSIKIEDEWCQAKSVGNPLNTTDNEGAQTISADGKWMFFTACNRDDGNGQCDIYFSQKVGAQWAKPVNLGEPVSTASKEKQPSVSPDGRTLYFASDRAGGFGGMDIWVSKLNEQGKWTKPVNLGEKINTKGDDISPFIHHDNQTLYFSSEKHLGLGGFDLFMSHLDSTGKWTTPVNMGYPINSYLDEIGLIINAEGNHAYYSSSRIEENGRDLYEFELYKEARPTPVSYMKGKVFDSDTKENLRANFELIDLNAGVTISSSYSDANTGEFLICIPTKKDYALNINKKGYLFYSENFTLNAVYEQVDPFLVDIPLSPIKVGKKVILKNIFYEINSFELKAESKIELDKTVVLLTQNPTVKVEISGHTDNVGAENYNIELSENRAKSVFDYLKEKGISPDRMSFKGYGMSQPIKDNSTEEGRKNNRRTELKITGI